MQKWTAFVLAGLLAVAFVVGLFIEPVDSEANSTDYWKAEFFDNTMVDGEPILVRNDRSLNFNWAEEAPAPNLPIDGFSVRWSANFEFDKGLYNFTVGADDGVRLWVDDTLVIDQWVTADTYTIHVASIELGKGRHEIRVEYYDEIGLAGISVNWELAPPDASQQPASVVDDNPPANPGQEDDSRSVANVATGRLNVRSGPGIRYERITQIFLYERYRIEGETINDSNELWYQIDLRDGRLGWVSARFVIVTGNQDPVDVTFTETPPAVEVFDSATGVTLFRLTVRATPDINGEILGYLDYQAEVEVFTRNSTSVWYKIAYDDGEDGFAWVFSPYVSLRDVPPYDIPFE